ncbi:MAG: hypothetical protein IAI50_15480 [Candidatus Eremiobacteraeota bacterium]|nr:hypothetical protein [Candidatus Eremiobacteraeota bacterium]
MNYDLPQIVKLVLGGVFGLAFLTYLAKDGTELGAFISSVGTGTAAFAKGIQA